MVTAKDLTCLSPLTGVRRVIIKLGAPGTISGFDVDTANFSGNEAPAVAIYGLNSPQAVPTVDSPEVRCHLVIQLSIADLSSVGSNTAVRRSILLPTL